MAHRSYIILITLVASLGGLLFGFDMAVISGVLPFLQKQFSLSAVQEGWFVASALIGCIAGVCFSGELSDRFGRRKLLLVAAVLFLLSALGCAWMPGLPLLVVARFTGGIGVGIASNVVPLYISEIAPAKVRGRLVTCYQLAITVGILLAYLSNAGLLSFSLARADTTGTGWLHFLFVQEAWRGMFLAGALPALLFLAGLTGVPESPRWLIQKGHAAAGERILERINGAQGAAQEVQSIRLSTEQEQGGYRELLAPGMRKALLLGLLLPLFSQFSGINAIIYYGPRILTAAGIDLSDSLISQVVLGAANMIFTLIAVWKVDTLGRRPLYLIGSAGATAALLVAGGCFYLNATTSIVLMMAVLLFLASFAFSIGPLKFVVAAEIFPNKIRGRALALSILVMWVADTVVGQLTPVLLEQIGPAGTFWLFALFCAGAFFTAWKWLPETKGRSLESIQEIWSAPGQT